MNCSMPGLPVYHHLPEFTQTHVHQVRDAIQPSHPLSSPSPSAPNPSQSTGASALASFLPKKYQGWSPSEWTGWMPLQSKGLSRVFSKPQFKSINSLALSLLHSPTKNLTRKLEIYGPKINRRGKAAEGLARRTKSGHRDMSISLGMRRCKNVD